MNTRLFFGKAKLYIFSIEVILMLSGIGCTHQVKRVMATYSNGNASSILVYPDGRDTTTFEITNYYPDGKIFKHGQIRNGKYVGKKVTYFENGRVYQIDSLFYPSPRHAKEWGGLLFRFNENGTISQEYTVKNGLFNGLFRQYSDSGVLIKEYYLKDDSIKNGLYQEFYKNGRVSLKLNYIENVLDGMAYFFEPNGDTVKYYNFKNNRMIFPYKRWLEGGQTITGTVIDSARKVVVWKWYDKNGRELKREKNIGVINVDYFIP
jgi:antitoxin component YwqK of YwqJK toxin-antitoxin module